ncbi:GFA family protein [Ovoidimarina sediminis]|uniref:GFA family protein n=1 Tax=Ovoidimarina sediminis TaxID=3079856 RepID=UPI0029140CB4|nr:GFA family protein [Rhodophyticola sp. MJ-SS7]MDU8946350.1 GFA family protein [Rhodophyticola sp. MJ-SS7]
MKMEGGCLCGAVRYRAFGPARMTFLCHCRDCQHHSGSGNLPLMVIAKKTFSVEGTTSYFESVGDSGRKVCRHFCPTCGSSLYAEAQALPDHVTITAGTLDNPKLYTPAKSIHVGSRVHWDHLVPPQTGD